MLTRFTVEADGRSSCARLRGREYTSALAAIGETVDPRWAAGVLGRRDERVEIIIGTPRGVEFRRSVPESRWSRQEYNRFLGVPWNPRGLHVEAQVASGRTRHKTKMIVAKRGPTPGCPACVGASSTHSRVGVRSSRRSSVAPATVHCGLGHLGRPLSVSLAFLWYKRGTVHVRRMGLRSTSPQT